MIELSNVQLREVKFRLKEASTEFKGDEVVKVVHEWLDGTLFGIVNEAQCNGSVGFYIPSNSYLIRVGSLMKNYPCQDYEIDFIGGGY